MTGARALAAKPRAGRAARLAPAGDMLTDFALEQPTLLTAGFRPAYLTDFDDAAAGFTDTREPRPPFGDAATPPPRASAAELVRPPAADAAATVSEATPAGEDAAGGGAAEQKADRQGAKAVGGDEARGGGRGGGRQRRPGKLVELHFVHNRKSPATGPAAVPRSSVRTVAATTPFSAPRTLSFGGVVPSKQKATAAPTPEQRDHRALFEAAAAASAQFHQQLSDAAQRLAGDAATLGGRLADRHQSALDDELRRLDRDLESARGALADGREEALDMLHEEADALRMRIGGAAGAALGKLTKLAADYAAAMAAPRDASRDIKSRADKALADLGVNGKEAVDSIDDLLVDPSPAYEDNDDVWTPPANEALDEYLPPRALDEGDRYDTLLASFTTPLAKLVNCLPCKFATAFATMDARVGAVNDLGPKAVAAARDAALGQLAATELQLEDMIERGAAGTDDMLVDQHDGARRQYLGSARAGADGETQRIEGLARSHVQTLTALAASQPIALQRVVDRLEEEKGRPEADFARIAATASRRLRASLASSVARQPMASRLAAEQAFAGVDAQARRFDEGIAGAVAAIERTAREMVDNSLASFAEATDGAVADMKPLPGSVTKACAAYLDPADYAFPEAVADLGAAVAAAGSEVDALLDGKATPQGGGDTVEPSEPLVCTMADASDQMSFMAPEPVMSSLMTPPPRAKRPADKPARKKGGAGGGTPGPPPAACFTCAEAVQAQSPAQALAPPGPPPLLGTNPAQTPSQPAAERMTVNKLITEAGKISFDPLAHQGIKGFQQRAVKSVRKDLSRHAGAIRGQLGKFAPDGDIVVRELHGTTAVQGSAYRKEIAEEGGLEERIKTKMRRGWSAPSTKKARIDAALAALDGRGGEAVFQELIVAFNFSDDNAQAQTALESLSAAQLKDLQKTHGAELIAMAKELSGADRQKFEALIGLTDEPGTWLSAAEASANFNAILMQEGIAGGRDVEGEKGWMKAGETLSAAGARATSTRLSGNVDTFGLRDDTEREAQEKRQWEDTQISYARRQGKVPMPQDGRPLSPDERKQQVEIAQDAMIAQATDTKTFHHEIEADENGYGGESWDTTDVVGDRHKLWIQRIVQLGPNSNETRAARLGIEANREGKPQRDGLKAAMQFASADAVEGGHYDEIRRKEGEDKAKADQDAVLLIYAQDELDRATRDRGVSEENKKSAEEVREELKAQVATKFGDDKTAMQDAVGILASPKGDALATIELAIRSEKKEIAIEQFKRMDAREIDKLVADYALAHPGEKGLDETLGINGNHWSWRNWNGATFSGDDANEIEIARMGVPQNDEERGEVALRVMNQQIDQAGWLGKALAGGEFAALERNAAALRQAMGVGDREIDARGRVVSVDAATGEKVPWGNFDKNGDFVPSDSATATAFERAIVMSRITADNYVASVDAIANFVATALVVVAAVVTTALTGGAAASIWIPMLVTAAAGLVGVGLNIAIKGGRYGRDDMIRDLVATVVQAATAGIGAAAGAALRGGTPALKALSGSMRMSEQALAKAAGRTTALRALTLGEEALIGAGSSAFASGANAAFDPAARRGDDYWGNLIHSIGRGAIGGGLGAVGARGGAKGFEALAKRLGPSGSQRALAAAIASGSRSEIEAAQKLIAAGGSSWGRDVAARAFASGASGSLSRGGELLYDREVRGKNIGLGQILEEVGTAGLQNFIQGAGEGAADRAMRRRYGSRETEQRWVEAQHGAAPDDAHTQPRVSPDAEVAARQAAPALAAIDGAVPADAAPARPAPEAAADPEPRRAAPPKEAEGDAKREPMIHAIGGEQDAGATRTLSAANDNGGSSSRIVLADTDMVTLGPIAEGTVFAHADPYDRQAANDNFGRMMLHDPTREAAVYYNPITGEHVVIQGGETRVGAITAEGKLTGKGEAYKWQNILEQKGRGHWVLATHYHPNRQGELATHISRRLPSGAYADLHVVAGEVGTTYGEKRTSRIYFIDEGKVNFTDFTVDPKAAGGPYIIDYPEPGTGRRIPERFSSIAEYHAFVGRVTGAPYPLPPGFQEPDLSPARRPPRALESGSTVQKLHGHDIAEVLTVGRRLAAGKTDEAHATVRRMGLVDEPDAMARLHLVLNEPKIPFETKKAVAAAVLEATRAELRASGKLAPEDDVHLFFHGAPQARADQLKAGGIDSARLAHGPQEDFGGGFYLSRQLENALTYTQRQPKQARAAPTGLPAAEAALSGKGEMIPFLVRDSDLGTKVNVERGGSHRAEWERFAMKNLKFYDEVLPTGPARFDPETRGLAFGSMQAFANRGIVFDKFLASLGGPHATPDIVFGELGKIFTSGYGSGDQQAVKTPRLAALLSEQIGFRTPAAEPDTAPDTGSRRPPGDTPEIEPHAIETSKQARPAATAKEAGTPDTAPPDAWAAEFAKFQEALQPADSDGPRALIDKIRAGDGAPPGSEAARAAAAAQKTLDARSLAPDAKVVNINRAFLEEKLTHSKGKKRQRVEVPLEDGTVLTIWRTYTAKNLNPPIKFDATLPKTPKGARTVVYQFGDGELRVWRNRAGHIEQESLAHRRAVPEGATAGPRNGRLGYEGRLFSHGEGGFKGQVTERAHAHGPGLGFESPFAIGLAPREVNQILQNRGVEQFMRDLRETLPPGAALTYSTIVEMVPTTLRQGKISYQLDISLGGERFTFAKFAINVETDPPGTKKAERKGTRGISIDEVEWHSPRDAAVARYFDHLREAVRIPPEMLHGLPRIEGPRRGQIIQRLFAQEPEVIERLAQLEDAGFIARRPPDRARFDVTTWRDDLIVAMRTKREGLVVVDTRGLGLTRRQLAELEKAIEALPLRHRRRIVRLR